MGAQGDEARQSKQIRPFTMGDIDGGEEKNITQWNQWFFLDATTVKLSEGIRRELQLNTKQEPKHITQWNNSFYTLAASLHNHKSPSPCENTSSRVNHIEETDEKEALMKIIIRELAAVYVNINKRG